MTAPGRTSTAGRASPAPRRSAPVPPAVIWHDVECGAYVHDIPVWQRLAAERAGPVLEIGAGTGRVALELARAGHSVTALDHDPDLVAELERRARSFSPPASRLDLHPVVADARSFSLGRRFALILVPMQTIQLLGGTRGRTAFLERALDHLSEQGRLAIALAERFELFDAKRLAPSRLPAPDTAQVQETIYRSHPLAVRAQGETILLERRRETLPRRGPGTVQRHRTRLDRLSPARLEQEARAVGLRPDGRLEIPRTPDHMGSIVVMLDG